MSDSRYLTNYFSIPSKDLGLLLQLPEYEIRNVIAYVYAYLLGGCAVCCSTDPLADAIAMSWMSSIDRTVKYERDKNRKDI